MLEVKMESRCKVAFKRNKKLFGRGKIAGGGGEVTVNT